MLEPGTLVHRRYRVTRPVGQGGMGAVYEAADTRLQCAVALKQTRAPRGAYPELDRAFEHEAQLLAALRHPVLPVVTDYFVEGDDQFLVMQFIPGEDLATALKRRSTGFPLDDVLEWLRRLLDALEYLHGHQPPIVHRDIKPANLKLTDRGELVLLDFGLAKGSARTADASSTTMSLMGYTPRYSPLEQMEGRGTGPCSDIYALAATVYHLSTGVAPPTAVERAAAVLSGRPDPLGPLHVISPEIPPALSAVIARAMAIDVAERLQSANEMRRALDGAETGEAGRHARRRPRPRRIDAAVPSQAEVGARMDLFVQVRFADSPRLGLEDWPLRHRPAAIEQVSEQVVLVFPLDPSTGLPLPARLEVRVVAPDFAVEGQAQQIIDVPPEEYSRRIAFLLTANRPGLCRINVEVYGAGAVYLGAVPVETEVRGGVVQAETAVATLLLEVLARELPGLIAARPLPVAAAPARPTTPAAARPPVPVPMAASVLVPLPTPVPEAEKETTAVPFPLPERRAPVAAPAAGAGQPLPAAGSSGSMRGPAAPRRAARTLMAAAAVAGVIVMTAGTLSILYRASSPGPRPSLTAQRQPGDSARPASPPAPAVPAAAPGASPKPASPAAAVAVPGAAEPPAAGGRAASRSAPPPPSSGMLSATRAPGPAAPPAPLSALPARGSAPPPPLSAQELAKRDILTLLEEYRDACERMDLHAVRRVFPKARAGNLAADILRDKSPRYLFEGIPAFDELDIQRGLARVRVRSLLIGHATSGSPPRYRMEETFTLQMSANVWLITGLTRKPVE
jgi:tRNA A-37 threonylcarbamoyl transferase component Bud32